MKVENTDMISEACSDSSMANKMQQASSATIPKDAHVMASILRDMGITEWEPRVINQLLEFGYNYVTTVLDDAKMLSSHAKKKAIDVEDVRLAVQMYTDKNVTSPPNRDVLLEVARLKNTTTLPIPKPTSGLRLPPDRFCLTSCNYKLRSNKKQPPPRQPYYYGSTAAASSSSMMAAAVKTQPKILVGAPAQGVGAGVPNFTMTTAPPQMRPVVRIGQPNKIQIQPANAGPAMFTMTINPSNVKRKADEMN